MGEIPHLQAAVSRLKDKPFEILAVSCDDLKEDLVDVIKRRKAPGIHTWSEEGSENPVASLYNIRNYPTWYLVDGDGVIRARDPFGDALIPAIEKALKRSRKASPSTDTR